eukprot:7631481-Pyramimonas_sp.AAC.1
MAAPHPFRHSSHTFRDPLGSSLSFAQPALRCWQLHMAGSIARDRAVGTGPGGSPSIRPAVPPVTSP